MLHSSVYVLQVVGLSCVPSWASPAPPFERAVSVGPSRFLTHGLFRLTTVPPIVLRRLLQRLFLVPEPASPRPVSVSCKQSTVRLSFSMKPHLPGCSAVSFSPGFFRLSTDVLELPLPPGLLRRAPRLLQVAQPRRSLTQFLSTPCNRRFPSCCDASFSAWSGLSTRWPRSHLDPRACVSTHSSSA